MVNLVLDLDNTLLSSISTEEELAVKKDNPLAYGKALRKLNWVRMPESYLIFERPGLQKFLDFVFKRFNVSVWTAASKLYALFIIKNILIKGNPERKLDYILFSHHCRISSRLCRSKGTDKCHKKLEFLEKKFGIKYDPEETIILDDHDEIFKNQPNNCIHIKAFDVIDDPVKSLKDKELYKLRSLLQPGNISTPHRNQAV